AGPRWTSRSGSGRGGEEELIELLVEEVLRLLLPQIEPVVVDQLLLELEPLRPTHTADLFLDSLADLVRERLVGQPVTGLAAAGTGDRRHRRPSHQGFGKPASNPSMKAAPAARVKLHPRAVTLPVSAP